MYKKYLKYFGYCVFNSQAGEGEGGRAIGQHAVLFNEYKAAVVDS